MHVSSRILFVLGFHLPWDSMVTSVCRKPFPSRFSAVSIHNGPLHQLDLPFIGPWTWIRQVHSTRPVGLYFHPLQLLLSLGISLLHIKQCGFALDERPLGSLTPTLSTSPLFPVENMRKKQIIYNIDLSTYDGHKDCAKKKKKKSSGNTIKRSFFTLHLVFKSNLFSLSRHQLQ